MDVLNKISSFLDDHIQFVTKSGYIIVAIGVITIARRSRLLTKFDSALDIPNHFVKQRIKLRGRVCDVRLDNVVVVQHLPSFRILQSVSKLGLWKSPEVGIHLSLAGVRLNNPGCVSLRKLLCDKVIWFELLSSRRPMEQSPSSVVYLRKGGFLRNVNVQAVKQGFGVARQLNECEHPRLQARMQRDLFKAQRYAAKKGRGIWMD